MGIMDRIKEEASSAVSATLNTASQQQPVQQQAQMHQTQPKPRIPNYVVLQVTLKEKMIGSGSGNLSELERVINNQASRGYRLHTITTAAGGSTGLLAGGDRIQATLVFEEII